MSFPSSNRVAVPFLAKLEPNVVDLVLSKATLKKTTGARTLQVAGEDATRVCLLRKGRAMFCKVTEHGDEILLHLLMPGDVFGLASMLPPPARYALNVDAVSDCELIVWEQSAIRASARAHPQLLENALTLSMKYIKNFVDRHARSVSGTAEERAAVTLLDIAERTGFVKPQGVEIKITNEELGSLSDISRFTTSRLLNKWQRKGTLSKTRGTVIIHAPEALTAVA